MRFAALLLCLILMAAPLAGASAEDDPPGLFGTEERRSSRLKNFPKWTDLLERHYNGDAAEGTDCGGDSTCAEKYSSKWHGFLDSIRDKDPMEQLRAVNQHSNRSPYIEDTINWGVQDYWETVLQFLIKHGDCEDYAISKYFSLKELGFSPDDMRIVVLKDNNLNVMHAVLAVYAGQTIYILDNQIPSVVEHTSIHHYTPIFSINEHSWWLHQE